MYNTKKIEEYIKDNKNAYFTSNKEIFTAIAVFSIVIAFFSRISLSLGTAVGLIIGYYIFNFLINTSKNH
jgi:Na+/H+-translocating membrane pyrophosphatase